MITQLVGYFYGLMAGFSQIGVNEIGLIFSIIIMDAALSGDNSIAINAMAAPLPDAVRGKAIWFGMGFAAILRLVALSLAAFILANPWVQILGGLYLIKLWWDHIKSEGDEAKDHKPKTTLVGALFAIGFLDLSLSLDNVIAVVAMTNNLAVIFLGVMISIAMLAVATQVVRLVMGRYPSLGEAAYYILAFLGINMLIQHTADFIIWTQNLFHASWHQHFISQLRIDIGDKGEIGVVGAIIVTAIAIDEWRKRNPAVPTVTTLDTSSVK
jgi:YjbE family integral membrane protein